MRKTFTLLCAMLLSVSMFAQDPEWLASGDEWDGETKTLTIKSNPSGSNYQYKGDFEHLVIAEGVTEIGAEVFSGCWKIIDVIIPASVTNIGSDAFLSCQSVADVYCYANPGNLTWNDDLCNDFKEDHETRCHVKSSYLDTYNTNWGYTQSSSNNSGVNVTFVGDLSEQDDPASASSTVIWDGTDLTSVDVRASNSDPQSQTIDGSVNITVTAAAPESGDYSQFMTFDENNTSISVNANGTLTFTPASGKLTSIIIECEYAGNTETLVGGSGWRYENYQLIWSSEEGASSVTLACDGSADGCWFSNVSSVKFTFAAAEPAPADPTPSSTHDPVTWDAEYLATFELYELFECKNFGNIGTYSGTTTANHDDVVATISAGTDGSYAELKTYNNNTSIDLRNGATLTFSTGLGQFESIVINFDTENPDYVYVNNPTEWEKRGNTLTWPNSNEISARNSVVLESAYVSNITSIVFTFASAGGDNPGDQPGDDPVVENKTATSVVIEGGNYYQGQFTLMDNDCGLLSAFGNPNVYLRKTELPNTISDMPLTITSSNESVVVASLTDYTDGDDHIYRSINFEQRDYGHAVITVSFAGNDTLAPSQASFDYYRIRNTSSMAACHVQDLEGNKHTDLVMTEGDKIALDLVRTDGKTMCYFQIGNATTTQKSCWKYDEELSHRVFYPHAAGLDTIVYEYFRSNSLDEQVNKKEDFHYWPYRQTIKIPVTIMPYLTPVSYCQETSMELNPEAEGNTNLSFSKTAEDLFNSTANQLEIKSVVSAENLQLALDSMATGTKEWNDILPGATTFNVAAGRGKIKIECQTVEGYELKVLIRNGGTATITQPTMDTAEVNYDVAEVSAVLVYLWPTGGSPAPKHRAPAATKDTDPKAIIKSITITPGVDIIAKRDDNTGLYYSTFFDGSYKYALPNDGTKAFVAKINGSDMVMTQIAKNDEIIPANTAVILQSPTGSFSLTPSDGSEVTFTPSDNQLHGVDSETDAPANCYVLSGHSTDNSVTGVGFYEFTGKIPAHKAYLTISGGAAYAPKKLRFVFNNEQQATGIDNAADGIMSEKRLENGQLVIIKNGVRYNAQGQIVK